MAGADTPPRSAEITATDSTTRRDQLVERLSQASLGAWDVLGVYLGDRLGLYRALADGGPLTSGELAAATGTRERYVREWLEQQGVGALLDVDDATAAPQARRYSLPSGHDEGLLDETGLNYTAPIGRLVAACTRPLDALPEALRSGQGVPYADYGRGLHDADLRVGAGDPDARAPLTAGDVHDARGQLGSQAGVDVGIAGSH